MSGIRFEAAKQLKAILEEAVPDLKIHVWHATADEKAESPCLGILPGKMGWADQAPDSEDVIWGEGTSKALLDVGELVGTWELRLLAKNPSERETFEDKVIAAFFQKEGAPGLIQAEIPEIEVAGVKTGFDAVAGFFLDTEAWHEEFAFSAKRWSWLELTATVPVLVMRDHVYGMNHLRTALTEDLTTAPASLTFDEIEVNEDGTTEKIS